MLLGPALDEKRSRQLFEARPTQTDSNPHCLVFSVGDFDEKIMHDCRTDEYQVSFNWVALGSFDLSVLETSSLAQPIETRDFSRNRVWKLMFKDSPVPEPEDGTVERSFGILSDLFEDENDNLLDEILRDIRGK